MWGGECWSEAAFCNPKSKNKLSPAGEEGWGEGRWKKLHHSCFLRQERAFHPLNRRKKEQEVPWVAPHSGETSGDESEGRHHRGSCVTSARSPGLSEPTFPACKMEEADLTSIDSFCHECSVLTVLDHFSMGLSLREFIKLKFAFPM